MTLCLLEPPTAKWDCIQYQTKEPGERLESNIGSTAHTTMYNIHENGISRKWMKLSKILNGRMKMKFIHTHTLNALSNYHRLRITYQCKLIKICLGDILNSSYRV